MQESVIVVSDYRIDTMTIIRGNHFVPRRESGAGKHVVAMFVESQGKKNIRWSRDVLLVCIDTDICSVVIVLCVVKECVEE